jgi:cytochrome d ubiquinol oxidase subunit II
VHATWFGILALMLTAYAVLDGFDFGAGVVHLFVARDDDERRTVLSAIGPLWDGNEVWLIASGGVLVFAFPRAYAAAFSGMYLPLMIVLWLLVLRGISIEFRSQVKHPLWRAGWDAVFAGASASMAIVLGVALGNVVRGVPLGPDGYFQEDLFAARDAQHRGAIDAYTTAFGLFALADFGAHGATYLAWKTAGPLSERCRRVAMRLWIAAIVLFVLATVLTAAWNGPFFEAVASRPWIWPLPLLALASAGLAMRLLKQGRELPAFLASCAFTALLLVATAGALFPVILRSTIDPAFSLDVENAASDRASLAIGLAVWVPAIALAIGYFVYLFRSFRGKTDPASYH